MIYSKFQLYYFGTAPVLSFISNIITVPIVSILFIFLIVSILIGSIIGIIPVIGFIVNLIIWVATVVFGILGLVAAIKGEDKKLPFIGDIAILK